MNKHILLLIKSFPIDEQITMLKPLYMVEQKVNGWRMVRGRFLIGEVGVIDKQREEARIMLMVID